MSSFKISVVSVEEEIYSGVAIFASFSAEEGELGVLKGHIPLLTKIKPGLIKIKIDDSTYHQIFVSGGILEVRPDEVILLADTAIRSKDIDAEIAEEAKKKAEQILSNSRDSLEIARTRAELSIAIAQLSALKRIRNKH